MSCLVPVYGYLAACCASPAAWVTADLFLIPAYLCCWRRLAHRTPAGGAVLHCQS